RRGGAATLAASKSAGLGARMPLLTVLAKPYIRPGIAPGGGLGEPAHVMRPALRMAVALFEGGQASVGHLQQRAVGRLLDQVDLDQARAGRHLLAALPPKAVGQPVYRHDLAQLAARQHRAGDVDEIEPARPRPEVRAPAP